MKSFVIVAVVLGLTSWALADADTEAALRRTQDELKSTQEAIQALRAENARLVAQSQETQKVIADLRAQLAKMEDSTASGKAAATSGSAADREAASRPAEDRGEFPPLPDELHMYCTKCEADVVLARKDMTPEEIHSLFIVRNEKGHACPKCSQKGSLIPQLQCPQCKKWFVTNEMKNRKPPSKIICPYCATDLLKFVPK